MITGLRPGLAYGLLAFLAGAVLGTVRELALSPLIGGVPAALAEAAAMAVLLRLAARRALRLLPEGAPAAGRAAMAFTAFVLVLLGDALLGIALHATGLDAGRPPRSGAEETIGLALLGWLVAQPFMARDAR
jgi:hypothetical protein